MKKTQIPVLPISSRMSSTGSHGVAQRLNLPGHFKPSTSSSQGLEVEQSLQDCLSNYPAQNYFSQYSLHFPSGLFREKEAYNNFTPEAQYTPTALEMVLVSFGKPEKWIIVFKSSHLCHLFSFNNCSERPGPCSWVPTLPTHFVHDIFTALANE